jgi:hypothetical protein
MASLGNRAFRVQLARGILSYSELRGGEADIDIETPQVAVRPQKNGRYRVEVLGAETVVTVRNGEAQVASPQGVETLKGGQAMIIRGAGDDVEFRVADADPRDEWDQWNERRDDILKKSDSYRYMSRSISGGEDLDGYGDWRYVSGYGYCWFPSVAGGWAPYRDGRWVWLDYYGWTWVGYEPWGWAPYHYGRWYHHAHYGWGWYPGSFYHRHYWRPALVAFFGYSSYGGFSFGAGFGFGSVGWVPLGPGEPYYPWYGRHFYGHGRHGGYNNTTIYVDNSVNIYNNYRNARQRNGVTVVDADGFSRGLVNNPRSLRDTELRRATLMRGQIPVVPARESRGQVARASTAANASGLLGSDGARRNGFFNRQTGRREVARADTNRATFDQQREQVQRSIRSFADDNARRGTGASGAAGAADRGVARADTRAQRSGGSVVRGSVDPVDSGRSRIGTEAATSPGGVRGSSDADSRGPGRRDATGAASAGSDTRSSDGVRGRSADANAGRSGDWTRFGGNRNRTPGADARSARVPDSGSSSRIDRSSSGNDRGSRVERVSPSNPDSGSRVPRGRSADVGRSGASRVERSPSPSQQQRSAPPSRAPSMERSAPRSAPSDRGGGSRTDRSAPSRSRSELRAPDSGFTRFGANTTSSARVSRADQGGSPGRFVPRTSSRVSSSSRGGDFSGRSQSSLSVDGPSRIPSSRSSDVGSRSNSRVFSGGPSGDFSRSRSIETSPSRSRGSSPGVFSRGGGWSGSDISRSRSAPSMPSRSSGPSMSRGGGFGRSGGGPGPSISRGGSGGGSMGPSSGGRSAGGGARSGGRSRGR